MNQKDTSPPLPLGSLVAHIGSNRFDSLRQTPSSSWHRRILLWFVLIPFAHLFLNQYVKGGVMGDFSVAFPRLSLLTTE